MAEIFTRGGLNQPDKRGDALMQRHAEKLQREKEEKALKAMTRLAPNVSPLVWIQAFEECQWDVDRALVVLKAFQAAHSAPLEDIQRALLKLTSRGRGDSSSGSEPEGVEPERKRKRKSKGEKEKKRRKHEKRPKEKKQAKAKKREQPGAREEFGKHGIIGEADIGSKYSEFALWASEAKRIDTEVLPKIEERELFRTFCEDYNTSTLPHRKYYDLAAYQRRRQEKAAKRGSSEDEEPMAFNDEEELRRRQIAERAVAQQERLRDAYLELKHRAPGKAEDMREQELLRSQMALAYRTGDRDKAAQIQERLKPDEVKEREAARRVDPDNPLGV